MGATPMTMVVIRGTILSSTPKPRTWNTHDSKVFGQSSLFIGALSQYLCNGLNESH